MCNQCLTRFKEERNWTTWYGKLATALSWEVAGQLPGLWWHVALEERWLRLIVSALQNLSSVEESGGPRPGTVLGKCAKLNSPAQKGHDSEPFPNKRTALLLYYFLEVLLRRVTGKLTEKLLSESLKRSAISTTNLKSPPVWPWHH